MDKIQYLNTQAAKISSESLVRRMDGKIYVLPGENVPNADRGFVMSFGTSVEPVSAASTSKDKAGSANPFSASTNSSDLKWH